MKNFEINGDESASELIKQLVRLRWIARRVVRNKRIGKELIDKNRRLKESLPAHLEEWVVAARTEGVFEENRLHLSSLEIEIGHYLRHLCAALDEKATKDEIFEAINTNLAHRDTDDVRKYGDSASGLIVVLDLENSATRDACIEIRPLKWCHTMAFMNAIQTNPKLDRIVHDGANEFFGGVFGEYKERPLMERLAGRPL